MGAQTKKAKIKSLKLPQTFRKCSLQYLENSVETKLKLRNFTIHFFCHKIFIL